MLEMTPTGGHAGSQVLGEVRHRLVDVFLWQLFPNSLQGDFQLISRLIASARVYGRPSFLAWRPRHDR